RGARPDPTDARRSRRAGRRPARSRSARGSRLRTSSPVPGPPIRPPFIDRVETRMRRRHLIRVLVPGLLFARFATAATPKDVAIEASKARIKAEIEAAGFAFPLKKPRILIKKKDRTLELFDGDKLVKKYDMALGLNPEGRKE